LHISSTYYNVNIIKCAPIWYIGELVRWLADPPPLELTAIVTQLSHCNEFRIRAVRCDTW